MPNNSLPLPLISSMSERDADTTGGPTDEDSYIVNGYVDKIKGDKVNIIKRPGVIADDTYSSASEGRGLYYWEDNIYTCVDGAIYKNGASIHATVDTTSGRVYWDQSLEDSGVLIMQDSANLYKIASNDTVTEISPTYTLPATMVPGIVVLNQFVLVADADGNIYNSEVGNIDSNFTDSINAEILSDKLKTIRRFHNYCVAFGEKSIQLFYVPTTPSATGSPLEPLAGTFSYVGCASGNSVANVGDNLYWVGRDQQGLISVYTMKGLTPEKVSSSAVDRLLAKTQGSFDANRMEGYGFRLGGHDMYVLSYYDGSTDDDGYTIVYDKDVDMWYYWNNASQETFNTSGFVQSNSDSTAHFAYSLERYNAGASTDIRSYYVSTNNGQDFSADFPFTIVAPEFDSSNDMQKFASRLMIDGDTIPDSFTTNTVSISWKDDDEASYSTARTTKMTKGNKFLTRLGTFRSRRFKFDYTGDAPFQIGKAYLTFMQGSHGVGV